MNLSNHSETARQFVVFNFHRDVLRTLCRIHQVPQGNGTKRDMAVNLLNARKVTVNISALPTVNEVAGMAWACGK